MEAIPPILSSAAQAFQNGFALQDKAAGEVVQGSLATPDVADTDATRARVSSGDQDPLLNGIVDTIRAQTLVSSGAALIHAYDRTNDDLFKMLEPERQR